MKKLHNMKKICMMFALILLVSGSGSTVCKAYAWKTMSINQYTRNYTSSTFDSHGDMLLNVGAYGATRAGFATLTVERKSVSGDWTTAYTKTLSLKVGANLYTHFGTSITNCRNSAVRIKFQSDVVVRFSGSVRYFA